MSRNDVGEFYTRGQRKCRHCGLYYPEPSITSHEAGCRLNPANQSTGTDDDD